MDILSFTFWKKKKKWFKVSAVFSDISVVRYFKKTPEFKIQNLSSRCKSVKNIKKPNVSTLLNE